MLAVVVAIVIVVALAVRGRIVGQTAALLALGGVALRWFLHLRFARGAVGLARLLTRSLLSGSGQKPRLVALDVGFGVVVSEPVWWWTANLRTRGGKDNQALDYLEKCEEFKTKLELITKAATQKN